MIISYAYGKIEMNICSFWEPLLLQQIEVKLLEIKSEFQFCKLTSGKKVLVYQKVRYECHLF